MNGYRPWALALLLLPANIVPALATPFGVTNLVSDDTTVIPAQLQDPSLKNAWGVTGSGASPFWVADNATGESTLYTVNSVTGVVAKQGLTVTIPGDGTVTGTVFNSAAGGGAFNADNFLFVSEDGTVSGWRNALGTTAQTLVGGSASNVYKGTTFATITGHSYLYSTNFKTGQIDVLKGDAGAPSLTGTFIDPGLPAGYAPFDIKNINGTLYVTYALQDPTKHDDVAGAGNGFVSAFDLQGKFLGRVASQGTLDSPWGLALAPASFGSFAGDLLVGNFGDGTISAFDLLTDTFVGQLADVNGAPLSIDGLWGLIVGGGGNEGDTQRVYFTAGPNGEADGLFGVIAAVPEPASIAMFGLGLVFVGFIKRLRAIQCG